MNIIIVDSNCIGHIAKHAFKGLSHAAMATGVIFGFLKQVINLAEEFKTNKFIFAWDSNKSIRKVIYPDYKENRKIERSEEVIRQDKIAKAQFVLLRTEILPHLGFKNIFMAPGYEADDIIGTILKNRNDDFVVVTRDKDMYQLLDFCIIYDPVSKKMYTDGDFVKEYGIAPVAWSRVLAIAGCASDNVKGIEGIGIKSVCKYMRDELKTGSKTYQKIAEKEFEYLTKNIQLVKLPMNDLKLSLSWDEDFSMTAFQQICETYNMRSLLQEKPMGIWYKYFCGGQ